MTIADPEDESQFAAVRSRKLRLIIPLTVAFAFMMEQLDSTIITTAIPDIARSLDATPLQMNLAITSYILSLAVFIPVSGWFADRFGARRVFVAALVIFSIASGLCGQAGSLRELVIMRMLQGFGGAMMTPVGRLILLRAFPRSQLMTAMTYMSIPAVIGPTAGPLIGGFLTTYANWRWLFYVNIPPGLLGIALALRYVEDGRLSLPPRFDVVGFLLCGAGLAALQFAIEAIGHPILPPGWTVALFAAAAILLAAYTIYARRRDDPAVDLTLFRNRSFRVSSLAGGLSRMGANAVPFMLPLMLQVALGMSPIESGSLTFVMSAVIVFMRPMTNEVLRLVGFRALLTANAVASAATIAAFALVGPSTPHWQIVALAILFGIGRSTQFMTTNTLTYADMPPAKLSRSTSLGGVIQQLTISFGVSVAAALLAIVAGPLVTPSLADFHRVFLLVAVITLFSAPWFLLLRREDGANVSGRR
jgi:EmrB/QacA subfamily drug resistance transporter